MKQITNNIMMIKPVSFRYNEQTAVNNYYQRMLDNLTPEQIQTNALSEFNAIVEKLQNVGVTSIPKDIPINIVDKKYLNNMSGSLGHNDLKGFTQIESNILNNNIINRVYHIYILFGLTKIEFDAVLAHELIHVWLEENEQTYSDAFTEGFCNLASALIYINDNTKFSKIHLNNMMYNNDPLYGDGYRKCKNLLNLYGWDLLIKKTLEGDFKF